MFNKLNNSKPIHKTRWPSKGGNNQVQKIKEIRESKGITQDDLAAKAGISRATLWRLESGEDKTTTTKTLLRIADALGVKIIELFDMEDV